MTTVEVLLWTHQANRNGEYPVRIRISKNRKTTYKTIGHCKKNHWNPEARRVTAAYPSSKRFNLKIAEEYSAALGLSMDEKPISTVKAEIHGKSNDFYNYARDFITKHKNPGTFKRYNTIINKLEAYRAKLLFEDLTPEFLRKYETYLKEKGNDVNTIHANFRGIRAVINCAIREGKAETSPFLKFKLTKKKTSKEALSIEELNNIRKVALFDNTLEWHSRNLFLFSYNCWGIRIGDLLTLKRSQIKEGVLIYKMRKSQDGMNIKLNAEALEILKRYPESEYVFPFITGENNIHDQVSAKTALINKFLKKLASRAKVETKLTTHVARHTFSKHMLDGGIDIGTLRDFLGHENDSTTRAYASGLSNERLGEIASRVIG